MVGGYTNHKDSVIFIDRYMIYLFVSQKKEKEKIQIEINQSTISYDLFTCSVKRVEISSSCCQQNWRLIFTSFLFSHIQLTKCVCVCDSLVDSIKISISKNNNFFHLFFLFPRYQH